MVDGWLMGGLRGEGVKSAGRQEGINPLFLGCVCLLFFPLFV